MCRLPPRALIRATLLLTALSPFAAAEYLPPPKLDDLLRADCAAIGHFVDKDGAVEFAPARVLWGDVAVVEGLRKDEDFNIKAEADGGLTAWTWGSATGLSSMSGYCPEDATQRAIWFFFKDEPSLIASQPVELTPGFTSLRHARGTKPDAVFRLLQRLDFDMRRDAMEDLVAGPNRELVRELHRIALARESLACRTAVDVLIETRLLDADRFWGAWTDHPATGELLAILKARDRDRVTRELRKAIEDETRPARLDELVYLAQEDVDTSVRRAPAAAEPPARYSEKEERDSVVGLLTSSGRSGFVMESAGREIARHFLAEGFERLKGAAASPDQNAKGVYEGMGYVRHPTVFTHLVERAMAMSEGDDSFPATLRAIGRENQERSFEVLKRMLETRIRNPQGFAMPGAFDALGLVRDERALDLLKGARDLVTGGSTLQYIRARAAHGDPWAIRELLTALHEPSQCELLEERDADDVIGALLLVDTPDATEAIRWSVRNTWPMRWEAFDEPLVSWCMGMENYAGDARRTTALGEIARRDARWLAGLALEQMGSSSISARVCGAHVFRGLTGRSLGFDAEAFAAERKAPLLALKGWWAEHGTETREQWLLSHFREKGFSMTHLDDMASLPGLVRALASDPLTHDLAVERISVITGKYFTEPTLECGGATYFGGGQGQEDRAHMTARVTGWLAARNLLPAGR